ncbi:MAG: SPASM domain-containing protein [Tissierellia bacterium]|nr:SPASM domain-containing protein [Tissierellia bacterium]
MFKKLSVLVKPSSGRCNLECRYCFYKKEILNRQNKNNELMSYENLEILVNKAIKATDEEGTIDFNFQGGEPMLRGLDFYEKFIAYVNSIKKNRKINYTLQTNGSFVDDNWAKFFKKNRFLIGISLDGYEQNHNYYRKNPKNNSYSEVINAIKLFEAYKVDYNILTVLTGLLSRNADKLYEFYKKNNIKYVQIISCINPIKKDRDVLDARGFERFWNDFFKLWYEDYKKGDILNVDFFEQLIPMFKNIKPTKCGMLGNCSLQFVIESNLDVYPCDFFAVDEYKMGNLKYDEFFDMAKNTVSKNFINSKKNLAIACKNCKVYNLCRGNCKIQNQVFFNKGKYLCAYRNFILENYNKLTQIASNIKV